MKRSMGEPRADHYRRMVRVMRTGMRASRVRAWGAVAALTIGLVGVAGPASAAPPASNSAPVATITAVAPVGDTVTVTYTINRAAKQISQPVCTLDMFTTTVDCGDQTGSSTKKLTTYSTTLTGLADDSYMFEVRFTLTDGGTATTSAEFTITTAPSTYAEWETACNSVSGQDFGSFNSWTCRYALTETSSALAALGPICDRLPGVIYTDTFEGDGVSICRFLS